MEETLTKLMLKLDEEENTRLFTLVRFLLFSDQPQEINDLYGQIILKINNIKKQKKSDNNIGWEQINEIINIVDNLTKTNKHEAMLEWFYKLSEQEQKNIVTVAEFIVYCKTYRLRLTNSHYEIWGQYQGLIENIKQCLGEWI